MDPLKTLTPSLLCKLGSIAIHAKEWAGPHQHLFDREAIKSLLDDPEVKEWLEAMDAIAMLPKMRSGSE